MLKATELECDRLELEWDKSLHLALRARRKAQQARGKHAAAAWRAARRAVADADATWQALWGARRAYEAACLATLPAAELDALGVDWRATEPTVPPWLAWLGFGAPAAPRYSPWRHGWVGDDLEPMPPPSAWVASDPP